MPGGLHARLCHAFLVITEQLCSINFVISINSMSFEYTSHMNCLMIYRV